MRAVSLFAVFCFAKVLALWGLPIGLSPLVPLAYLWQDVAACFTFWILDRGWLGKYLGWALYTLCVAYAALNVPVTRVLSTPLTWPILRAAGGPLSDSIALYITPRNVTLMIAVVVVGVATPVLFSRSRWMPKPILAYISLGVLALGPLCVKGVETYGLHRNVLVALVLTSVPRLSAEGSDQREWRKSPFPDDKPLEPKLTQFRGAGKGKNVLFVILESTGAQYLGAYGASSDPMPNLTRLAARGILVENAYSVYPESIKGLFGTLCSTFPAFDSIPEQYEKWGPPSIAAMLASHGYRTAMFHSGRFRYLGMESIIRDRGFEVLEDAGHIGGNHKSSFGIDDERQTVKRILQWIDGLRREERFFVNFLPIAGHHPYASPQPWSFPRDSEQGRYLNAIHHADAALGALVAGLEQRGLLDDTVIAVIGDHGEAFGQHPGNFAHTLFIYEENVRVPFVVVVPGMGQGIRAKRLASLLDMSPTLLEIVGIDVPAEYQGHSILDGEARLSLFFTDYSLGLLGVRDGNWKLIWETDSRRAKLFDLSADPEEKNNLASSHPERVSRYSSLLMRWSAAQKHRLLK